MNDVLYNELKRLKRPNLFRKIKVRVSKSGFDLDELLSILGGIIIFLLFIFLIASSSVETTQEDSGNPAKEATSSATQQ